MLKLALVMKEIKPQEPAMSVLQNILLVEKIAQQRIMCFFPLLAQFG